MPRILHIGLGNFHRAHQAWYTAHAPGTWAITGVAMRNGDLVSELRRAGGYTLGIRSAEGLKTEEIAVHDRLILASDTPEQVIEAITDPDLHIITLTITEKGYCLAPGTDRLDLSNPAMRDDLAGTSFSALGLLVRGLAARHAGHGTALTVISCDNISGNGHVLARAVSDFALAAGLAPDPETTFPNTMVDRITPATTGAISAEITRASGGAAAAPVMTEAFSEWIIEDDFAGPRPAWEDAGVEIVPDVAPYEMRKLRLLNAAHSYLAYAGQLAGYRYVHEAMADPALRDGVERLWDEAQATLPDAVLPTTPAYRTALIERFAVTEMRHELAQIACDGSLKLRERLLPLVTGLEEAPQARRAIAAWVAFAKKVHETGQELRDPNARQIANLVEDAETTLALCTDLVKLIGLPGAAHDWLNSLAAEVDALDG